MSLMSNPYLNKLRDDICKLVELNKSKDILYSKMRLYGCMDWNLASDKRKLLSPQHMDEVETRVINYLSRLPLVYQRLFILYVLVGSSPSMTSSISSELHKNSLQKGDFKTREYESSIQLPWNITSKIKSFVNNQEKKVARKTRGSPSTELQCTSSLFRVDPHFMRYTLVPVPVCPIQLRSKISGEPNSGLFKEPRVVTGSNDNTCSQGKKMHSDSSDDWNDLIQKSWDSISYEIKQAYNKIKIRYALMFERNIYCGPFSIYVLLERQPNQPLCKRRVIHVDNRSHWLAHCEGRSQQRTIKFIDITMKSFCEKSSSNCIHKQNGNVNQSGSTAEFMAHLNRVWLIGHAGSVKTLWLDIKLQILLSGSYDTSIRLWNLSDINNNNNQHCLNQQTNLLNPISFRNSRSKCIRIFHGHTDTILCIWLDQTKLWSKYNRTSEKRSYSSYHSNNRHNNNNNNPSDDVKKEGFQGTYQFASGSVDRTCCIWRLDEQKPLWIMKHSTPITSVGLRGYICTTGEHSGRINVWRIGNKKPILIKVLTGHTDVITALRFDNYHLVTSSRDKSVKIWSIIGEFSDCIGTLVHTGEVLCVELIDLRIITGCSDGRIRVWNLLTQHCQRILPGNYRHDPIISIMPLENRLIVNTQHNILALNFDTVKWEYHESVEDKAEEFWLKSIKNKSNQQNNNSLHSKPSYAESRYIRSCLINSADPRFFKQSNMIGVRRKSACRSLSEHSKSNRMSRISSGSSIQSNSNRSNNLLRNSKKKSFEFEFLISPPIPGTYAVKHSVIKRPKSAFAVTKELKQKEHEQLLYNNNNNNNNNLFNQSMKQNISTIEHQTKQVKYNNDNNTTTTTATTTNTTTNNHTNIIDYSKLLTNQYFYQSSYDINQFKYYLLKQIHYLKKNQFNHKQNVQSIKDTYIDLDIKYNNNIVTKYNELDQLDILINDNFNKSYQTNSSKIHKLRSYSAPSINRKSSGFSNFNIKFMNHWKQDNEQCINLNSIQLPNLIVS
uniref:F-box/WD repeat-containing protein 10 n=1 Tax=Schistosoma haematobium TaxID=6185 RepID=A0A094ZGU4_SCHHA